MAAVNVVPDEIGYDTPVLMKMYLTDAFDMTYSAEHCWRLLHDTGILVQTARPRHYKANPDAQQR